MYCGDICHCNARYEKVIMRDLMMLFGVTLGKRYTNSEKNLFYKNICECFEGFGYKVDLQEKKSKLQTVSNIVVGDASKAKIIVAAAYDTPTRVLFPGYKYYPFHTSKNVKSEKINLLVRIFIIALLAGAAYLSGQQVVILNGFLKVLCILLTAIIAIVTVFSIKPKGNRFNFNRNSASIALMTKLAADLKENKNVAFVFLDKSVESFEGLKFLKESDTSSKPIIMLDSISDGEKLYAAHQEAGASDAEKLIKKMKQNNLELFSREYSEEKAKENILYFGEKLLYLVSGSIEKKEFIVKGTRSKKDIKLDIKRLEGIEKALYHYIKEV